MDAFHGATKGAYRVSLPGEIAAETNSSHAFSPEFLYSSIESLFSKVPSSSESSQAATDRNISISSASIDAGSSTVEPAAAAPQRMCPVTKTVVEEGEQRKCPFGFGAKK